jgi:hypothetical protein
MHNLSFTYDLTPTNFNLKFKPVSRPPLPWKEEILHTAEYIRNNTTKPIIVASSGGIDSEAVCLAFLSKQIPFRVLSVRYVHGDKNDFLDHDLGYAIKFCKEHQLEHIIVDLDPFAFYEKEIHRYIYQGWPAINIFKYLQMFLLETIDNMDCTGILGCGEQLYTLQEGKPSISKTRDFFSILDFLSSCKNIHFPFFFHATPEQTLSYLNEPLVDYIVNNPVYLEKRWPGWGRDLEAIAAFLIKQIVIQTSFPSMEHRRKFGGFETLMEFKLKKEAALREMFPWLLVQDYVTVEQMKLQLQGKA